MTENVSQIFLAGAFSLFVLASPAAADGPPSAAANRSFLANKSQEPGISMLPSGLEYRIVKSGFGRHPSPADTVEIAYSARLIDGRLVDSASEDLPANLQVNSLMPGLREALEHMQVGDRWQLFIPAGLGFGSKGNAAVPPGQTLVFDIALLAATRPSQAQSSDGNPLSVYSFDRGTDHQAGAMFTIKQ